MALIHLTRGMVAAVNDDDFEDLSRRKWHAHMDRWGKWYAICKIGGKSIKMHRYLLKPPRGIEIDHRDGDGLNNTRNNLRICLHAQNVRNQKRRINNKSGYKGVYFHKKTGRWAASICNGKTKHLGLFDTPEEAARKYDSSAIELFGEFCLTNQQLGLLTS